MSHVEQGFTKIPNTLFAMMPLMIDAELKVVLAVARKTYGWQKECAEISISQLQKLTGLSRQSVIKGIEAATERGILQEVRIGKRGIKTYRLVIIVGQSEETGEIFRPVSNATGPKIRPVSNTTGLKIRPDTGPKIRPVSNTTGLKTRHTKDKEKTKEKGNKKTDFQFLNSDLIDGTLEHLPTKTESINTTEITVEVILAAVDNAQMFLPIKDQRRREEFFRQAIQEFGGKNLLAAIERVAKMQRRTWAEVVEYAKPRMLRRR